ncbi:hypothetical protein [Bacillus thuringiensis]|nr:hypothetical protein [Bacillus thuringiensis]
MLEKKEEKMLRVSAGIWVGYEVIRVDRDVFEGNISDNIEIKSGDGVDLV